jgi:peptidoglycan/xylan/chitin deacetylase (PgdA/CDA1 family)
MPKVPTPPQFVCLAFDGSNEPEMWQATRSFATDAGVHFTYFISGVYFLLTADKNDYIEPTGKPGKSNIGFGGTLDMMKRRLEQVRLAMSEGHEIGSHAIGHFDGAKWTAAQWDGEFAQFTKILTNVWQRYNKAAEPAGWKNYFAKEVSGFRAPYLAVGDQKALRLAFKKHGMDYDTSLVNNMNYWPRQIGGVWNFPLAMIKVAGTAKTTLSMDYNFLVSQTGGKDGPKEKQKEYEDQMVQSYVTYFNNNYFGNRAPVHIGHHFSQMQGGAYWRAMQRIARYVKKQPNVVCGTYKELMAFCEKNKALLNDYQAGNFDKAVHAPAPRGMNADVATMSIPVKPLKPVSQMRLDKVQARKRTAKSTGCCAPASLEA